MNDRMAARWMGAGKAEDAMDAGNLFKPMLARGELHCTGATTTGEYRNHIEKDAALERRFQPVLVDQPQAVVVDAAGEGGDLSFRQAQAGAAG